MTRDETLGRFLCKFNGLSSWYAKYCGSFENIILRATDKV